LKLAEKLERYGIKIIGTDFKSLDLAEDRGHFSQLLKDNDIPYPEFGTIEDADHALELSQENRLSTVGEAFLRSRRSKHENCDQ
jgi:carbamoyl-phosphate synthase large subunit